MLCIPVVLVPGRLKLEGSEFKVSVEILSKTLSEQNTNKRVMITT